VSPLRKFTPGATHLFGAPPPARRWGLPLAAALSAAVAVAAITVCTLVLISHETQRRATIKQAAAVGYVQSFMTEFSSPDPFHANAYTDRILAQATGDFAQQYRDNQNQILIQVARSEPTTGSVLDAGVARCTDDGSVEVLVVTKFTSKSSDGKVVLERENRWVVTAKQEGDRWKISNLIPML
jgi:Mce-associated membrane protein